MPRINPCQPTWWRRDHIMNDHDLGSHQTLWLLGCPVCDYRDTPIWRCPFRHRGTPSHHHPFRTMGFSKPSSELGVVSHLGRIFHSKPCSYGGTPMTMETSISRISQWPLQCGWTKTMVNPVQPSVSLARGSNGIDANWMETVSVINGIWYKI